MGERPAFPRLALKRFGLLMTPEERDPPAVAVRAGALARANAAHRFDEADALTALHADTRLADDHAAMLPDASPRPRGAIDPERTLAGAKLAEAETIADAAAWLGPKERMALLHDRGLLDRLSRLDPA